MRIAFTSKRMDLWELQNDVNRRIEEMERQGCEIIDLVLQKEKYLSDSERHFVMIKYKEKEKKIKSEIEI